MSDARHISLTQPWRHDPTAGTRGGAMRSRPVLFIAYLLLAFGIMGANPFRGESITPLDVLVKQHAFSWADEGQPARHGERSDVLNGLLPYWINAREQIRSGHFPKWNDIAAGGVTFLVPTYSMFTPAFAVFAVAPTPALGFHLAIVLNLAIAGFGMHLFLRRHVRLPAAICGAATFMVCGFHAAWLYWPHVHTSIWAPWLLLAVDGCTRSPGMRSAVGLGLATAMVILGGFPFVTEVILCAGGLYFLVSWRLRHPHAASGPSPLPWYVLGSAFGFLATLPLLLELHGWLQQFDLGYREGRGSYLRAGHMTRLLPPWAYQHKRVEQTMYVGLLLTLAAAASVLLMAVRPRATPRLALFAALLLVLVGGLVFGLWPMWLVGWFPGMSFNSWSRAIGVLDIAIILLGVTLVDRAWRRAAGTGALWIRILVLLLVGAQIAEITHFFRRYNGPAPASYFYPEPPAVSYVRSRAGPFDYVITDRAFDISGEIGAFGLRDWYAHQLRTPAHKRLLDDLVERHRVSHTASRFPAKAIDTAAQALADLNVRYIVVDHPDDLTRGPARENPPSRTPLPPQPGDAWVQHFDVTETDLPVRAISVRLATYAERSLKGVVALVLSDGSGNVLGRSAIDARTVKDNALAEFHFPEPVVLQPGNYRFALAYRPLEAPARHLTAWSVPVAADETDQSLFVGTRPFPGSLEYVLHVGDSTIGHYRRVFMAAGISVFENTRAPRGPYFLRGLAHDADPAAGSQVSIVDYAADAYTLRYEGTRSGFVVVPASLGRGWQVAVNGTAVAPSYKHGLLPAIPVDGPSQIVFEYRPWQPPLLLVWLGSLCGLLGSMALLGRHQSKARARGVGPAP